MDEVYSLTHFTDIFALVESGREMISVKIFKVFFPKIP